MKKNVAKKTSRIVMTLCLMLVVAIASVGGTLAWLTATTTPVTNTFAPTGIDLTLVETTPENRDNIELVPGVDIAKDPKVSASCDVPYYVFVEVTAANWPADHVTYSIADDWTALDGVDGVDGVYYKAVTDAAALTDVSILAGDKVTVSGELTEGEMPDDDAKPTLTFKAYAIQMAKSNGENFTPGEAWTQLNPPATDPE